MYNAGRIGRCLHLSGLGSAVARDEAEVLADAGSGDEVGVTPKHPDVDREHSLAVQAVNREVRLQSKGLLGLALTRVGGAKRCCGDGVRT
jgi:hypothetical protein